MSEVKWTTDQLDAIESSGSSLLVSAAAGSGKTAVLVERVIRRICRKENPSDISNLLIVTFTKAAAAEMKAKITRAITKKMIEEPANKRLRRQLTLIDHAQITTVHSFCMGLVREHFSVLGLAPDFRMCDPDELEVMKRMVLEDMVEARYSDKSDENQGFYNLVEALSASRDDKRLTDVVMELYNKIQSHPYPVKWLDESLEKLESSVNSNITETDYGKVIVDHVRSTVAHNIEAYTKKLGEIAQEDAQFDKYSELFIEECDQMHEVLDRIDSGNWDFIRSALRAITFRRAPIIRKCENKEFLEEIKSVRDGWKKSHEKLCEIYMEPCEKDALEDMASVIGVTKALFGLVKEYDERLANEKRSKNIIDFNDLEHMSASLLVKSYDGASGKAVFTDLAHDLSERFDEIMVDEYQDTNLVQDLVFRALSKNETNLYMVGDVKQSIYGFRLADPRIFVGKYGIDSMKKIMLSKNFRSRGEVLDSVNYIFESIMSSEMGDTDYTEKEALYLGAPYPQDDGFESELCCIPKGDESIAQPDYVAKRVKEMLTDENSKVFDRDKNIYRRVQAKDIAILLRTTTHMTRYRDALAAVGIKSFFETRDTLLETDEVSTVFALLEVLDNPHSDLQLVSVMRSPIYGFTLSDLAVIRKMSDDDFYSCVVKASQEDCEAKYKCMEFLSSIDALRFLSYDMTVDRLLWHIYYKIGVLRLYSAMENGKARKANLISFLDMAKNFEKNGYRGLYNFVHMAKSMIKGGNSPKVPVDAANDGVTIMTVHKSKGLEFPIVFYSELNRKFNLEDLKKTVLIHQDYGAGFRRRLNERRIEYPTVQRNAIKLILTKEMHSEELRIMYVAMTRAKEKMIVTCEYDKNTFKTAQQLASYDKIPAAALEQSGNPMLWLLAPILKLEESENKHSWVLKIVEDTYEADKADDLNIEEKTIEAVKENTAELSAFIHKEYDYSESALLPSKLTATAIKGRYLDNEVTAETSAKRSKAEKQKRPRFLEEAGMTGAERGIALHLAMQFIDFEKCSDTDSIAAEIDRLRNQRILSSAQAESIDVRKIYDFFTSELGKKLLNAKHINREFKFSLLCDKSVYETGSKAVAIRDIKGDSVLLQGVIDCYFELSDGSIAVLDFKTDNVNEAYINRYVKNYEDQIKSYAYALERITNKRVSECYLYFFKADRAVKLQI